MTEQEWMKHFSDNLRSIMYESGYTQREVADMAGVGESTLSRYLCGSHRPTAVVVVNLAYALDCSLDDLLDFGDRVIL